MHGTGTQRAARSLLRHGSRSSRRRSGLLRRGAFDGSNALLSLPLFPLSTVLHPTDEGAVTVYEPRYRALFRDLQARTPPGQAPLFGHLLSPEAAPPALLALSPDAPEGLPAIGVAAHVTAVSDDDQGRLLVEYSGHRRFKLMGVSRSELDSPYLVGAAHWLDDDRHADDDLERAVLSLLSDACRMSGAPLPEAVLRFAPPPERARRGVVHDVRRPAAGDAATWRRSGGGGGGGAGGDEAAAAPSGDPYLFTREALAKHTRQELFSFAAASVLQTGLPERIALLQCQDTAARLQYTLAALRPFLADLAARTTLKQAFAD